MTQVSCERGRSARKRWFSRTPIHVEITSPTASGAPTRPPDSNGWYNHPVTIAFGGSSFSGIASCTTANYAGPDTLTATVAGSCTDNAGKTVAATSAPFAYDATRPALAVGHNTGDHYAFLNWTAASLAPVARIQIVRRPGLHGKRPSVVYRGKGNSFTDRRVRNGVKYQYTLTAQDVAGNVAERTFTARPGLRLISPANGSRLVAPPLLVWTPARHATFYNVQLWRGTREVLSIWPTRAAFQLTSTWRFAGRQYRLRPGTYRWYVWPGYRRHGASHFGRRIGTRTFVVTRSA